MINRFNYILYILMGIMFIAGCDRHEDDFVLDDVENSNIIELSCVIENTNFTGYSIGKADTKALIDQTSNTDDILCNFLRLDADESWTKAYLSEGTIATVPDDQGKRSISLHPVQPYNTTDKDSRSRMIGWYPRTDDVPQTDSGTDVTTQYENFQSTCVEIEGKTCVRFTGLDGSKDLMVSDMKEGSFNMPFGFFTFAHYLSAVRVYAKSDRSAQDVGLWGEITEVVIKGQPTSCIIEIPQEVNSYGEVIEWGTENAKFRIQKDHLFGENDTDYPQNLIAEKYPVKLEGSDVEKYLGYSLVRPDQDLAIQVHTKAGIYNVTVPKLHDPEDLFKSGNIYDIHLNFNTDGTIFAYVEKDGNEKYFDLSAGHEYDNSEQDIYDYKNANCYIIHPDLHDSSIIYDGFCFDATVVGNGEGGIFSTGAQTFYPQNAHIEPYSAEVLWQTSPRLISQIELLYGYVRFKVAKETVDAKETYMEGNAVIAVYDKNKNILWSWHIWITDTPQDLTYTEGGTSITIMDRNLGATFGGVPGDNDQALESYGLYYQWGRKDPSMGPPTYDYSPINMITAPYYDYSSEMREAAEVVRLAMPTLQDAVENPMYLIMPTTLTQTYSFNWLYEKIDFLWGYDVTSGYTLKTIYDPCPYGYRVSGGELADLFTYASTGQNNSITNGTYGQEVNISGTSGTFFFPYSGYKGVDRGLNSLISSWKYVGQKGDYQSSAVSIYTDDEEYYMHRSRIYLSKDRAWNELNVGDYTGHQIQDHTNRRTAAPVRCVKNIDHKRLMVYVTPHTYTIADKYDKVKFTLYAYAFDTEITSATLSIGYHFKNDESDGHESEHHEYQIESWSDDLPLTWKEEFTFDFFYFKDDFDSTTGEFRFILNVKTADNINKQSSTTIRLQKNYVEFLNWENEETMFANTDINKRFRIYGDSEVESVEIWQKGFDSNPDRKIGDAVKDAQANLGSEYAFDWNYSTSGLKFDDPGTYVVYLKIGMKNEQELISETKTFIIEAQQWTEVTSVNDIETGNYVYLIMNVSSDDFAYDNGNYLSPKAVSDATCYFKFVKDGNNFLIQNVSTGDYAKVSRNTLYINEDSSNSATEFVIEYNATGKYFKIGYKSGRTYYWRQTSNSGNITITTGDSDVMRWKIYKMALN